MPKWKPISTAPHYPCWVANEHSMCVAQFCNGRWRNWFVVLQKPEKMGEGTPIWFEPTHWKPLPSLPSAEALGASSITAEEAEYVFGLEGAYTPDKFGNLPVTPKSVNVTIAQTERIATDWNNLTQYEREVYGLNKK